MSAGFEIYKRFYPFPDRFRLGDPVLVREVTGMDWPEFVDALEQMETNGDTDQVVLAGLAAVAFWQGNHTMSRDKVRRIMERTPQEDVELVGFDDDDEVEAGDVSPPAAQDGTLPSPSNGSAGTPAAVCSGETSQNGSGPLLSTTSAQG